MLNALKKNNENKVQIHKGMYSACLKDPPPFYFLNEKK